VPQGDLQRNDVARSASSTIADSNFVTLDTSGLNSPKMTAGDLAGDAIGQFDGIRPAFDVVPGLEVPQVATDEAQKRAIGQYGRFLEYEGRQIEILAPGDERLPETNNEGFIYIIDPARKVEIVDSNKPWIIPEDYLITPPSKRPQFSFEEITKPSRPPTGVEKEIGERMQRITEGKPFTEPPGTGQEVFAPLRPGADNSIDIGIDLPALPTSDDTIIGGVRYGDLKKLDTSESTPKRLTEEELRDVVFTTGFPGQDRVVGVADFDKDGKRDLLLRNSSTGEMQIWYMNGQNKIGEAPLISGTATIPSTPGSSWVIEGGGDFNNDQSVDIVWRELGSLGATGVWFMNNNQFLGAQFINQTNNPSTPVYTASNWRIDGIADFTGDGKADLLWRDYISGTQYVWVMNGTNYVSQFQAPGVIDSSWKISGVADFNGDGVQDIFWRQDSTGNNAYWQMNSGFQSINNGVFFGLTSATLGWTVEDVGDLNADSKPDIIWKAPDGAHWAWMLGNSGTTPVTPIIASAPRVPGNNSSANATFNSSNSAFNSEYGYGMVDTSAAIAFLTNQSPPLEQVDPIGFNLAWNNTRQNEILNLPEVWQQGNTGQGITVAVIDSGVMLNHPDLDGNIWVNAGEIPGDNVDNDGNGRIDDRFGWDFISNDNTPLPATTLEPDNHGTQVAGMIAAELAVNGIPVTGGAYNARIMALRAGYAGLNAQGQLTGFVDLAAATQAVIYAADMGARVINLSFGGANVPGNQIQTNFANAVNYAVSRGAVVVISAGNGSTNTIDTVFPAILAGTPGVIAVGATNAGEVGVTTSNNLASQVAAFSTGAGATVRSYVAAPGNRILTTTRNSNGNADYGYTQGTSFAAPLVAAAVATIRQAVPNATPAQITNALAQTADPSDVYL
jgi:hypothetical protein